MPLGIYDSGRLSAGGVFDYQTIPPGRTRHRSQVGHGRGRRKDYIVVDDQVFEVADEQDAIDLLRRLKALAQEKAAEKAQAAIAKPIRPRRNRKVAAPVPQVPAPQVVLSPGLVSLEAELQQAIAAIRDIYAAAVQEQLAAKMGDPEADTLAAVQAVMDDYEADVVRAYIKELH